MFPKLDRVHSASVVAEFLGTGVLVMLALILAETTGVPYFIATSVAVTLAMVYVVFGGISGGHFNPAITVGMWTARKVTTYRGISYILAQFLGAAGSWQLYQYLIHHNVPAKTTNWSWPMFLAEMTGAAVLAAGLTAVMMKGMDTLTSAITYGAAFFAGILIAATAAAGYLNPATALALRNFNAVYILGPLVGAIVGVNLYMWLFPNMKKK